LIFVAIARRRGISQQLTFDAAVHRAEVEGRAVDGLAHGEDAVVLQVTALLVGPKARAIFSPSSEGRGEPPKPS
jgi:hypothetical protein